MDYLDPQKKKRKRMYLMLMYVLLGIAIAIATVVLVYLVNGYSIDRQTGEVIQNGLVYIDSKPESADVYMNGEKQRGRTDARLVIPEGSYTFELRRDGYRKWQRSLTLEGGSLRRLTYARLIPEVLETTVFSTLARTPTMVSQSPDKRWIVMASTDDPLLLTVMDTQRQQAQLDELRLPVDILRTKEAGTWSVVEWADDNKTILMSYKTGSSKEFLLINREDGTKSQNLTTLLSNVPFQDIKLRAQKNDELYLFDETGQKVYATKVSDLRVELVAEGVITFYPYGDNTLLYVTSKDAPEGKVSVYLMKGTDKIKLRDIAKSEKYLLDMSTYEGSLVVGISSPAENRAIIYHDPFGALKENDFSQMPVPTAVLNVENPKHLEISSDSSVIALLGVQSIATHEFMPDRSYSFILTTAPDADSKLNWIDGQHMMLSFNGKQTIMDFDGSNIYELVTSSSALGAFFDKDYNFLFTYTAQQGLPTQVELQRTNMRTVEDR